MTRVERDALAAAAAQYVPTSKDEIRRQLGWGLLNFNSADCAR